MKYTPLTLWAVLLLACCTASWQHAAHAQPVTASSFAGAVREASAHAQKSGHAALLGPRTTVDDTRPPLVLPLEVSVALIGLDGDGALNTKVDAASLQSLLTAVLPNHTPSALEAGRPMSVTYEIQYHVQHVPAALAPLEATLKVALVPAGLEPPPSSSRSGASSSAQLARAYEAPAEALEAVLEAAYETHFVQRTARVSGAVAAKHQPYVLFLLAPDKTRIDPSPGSNATGRGGDDVLPSWGALGRSSEAARAEDAAMVYRYRYARGERTAAWLGRGRYAVIDLSAGPCAHGRLATRLGAASASASASVSALGTSAVGDAADDMGDAMEEASAARLPRLANLQAPYLDAAAPLRDATRRGSTADPSLARAAAELTRRMEGHTRGEMTALVMSAVRHLFAPDLRTKAVDVATRLLVPIVALTDTVDVQPFAHVNVSALRAFATTLLQPGQELLLVPTTHALHAHPRLALAVRRSMRSILTSCRPPAPILNSSALLLELHATADLLATGLLTGAAEDAVIEATFYNKHLPDVTTGVGAGVKAPPGAKKKGKGGVDAHLAEDTPEADYSAAEAAAAAAEDAAISRRRRSGSHGTRVVPVYLFTLWDVPPALLLDGQALHAGRRDAAIVLHTQDAKAAAPFFSAVPPASVGEVSEARLVAASLAPAWPQRASVAALAVSLGGLAAPYERFCPRSGKRTEDWLWGMGAHPFGPFHATPGGGGVLGPLNASSVAPDTGDVPFSTLLVDMAHRNSILTRVEAALGHCTAIRSAVATFQRSFSPRPMHEPAVGLSPGQAGETAAQPASFLDSLNWDASTLALGHRIKAELAEVEAAFGGVATHMYRGELDAAHVAASHALIAAYTLRDWAASQLADATDRLACCRPVVEPSVRWWMRLLKRRQASSSGDEIPTAGSLRVWVLIAGVTIAGGAATAAATAKSLSRRRRRSPAGKGTRFLD